MPTRQTPLPRRRRGAQPGNRNAFKHGRYTALRKLPGPSPPDMEQPLELSAEGALLDDLISRTFDLMDECHMSTCEWNASLRAVVAAIGRKESIHRTRKLPSGQDFTIQQLYDELKAIPFEQD